jgi:hypothetical protein
VEVLVHIEASECGPELLLGRIVRLVLEPTQVAIVARARAGLGVRGCNSNSRAFTMMKNTVSRETLS